MTKRRQHEAMSTDGASSEDQSRALVCRQRTMGVGGPV